MRFHTTLLEGRVGGSIDQDDTRQGVVEVSRDSAKNGK
jgi:hypothetical protein